LVVNQRRQAHRVEHILPVIGGGTIRPQRNVYTRGEKFFDPRQAAADAQIAGGIVHRRRPAPAEQRHVFFVDPDRVST
jgi:hypothetical protein